MTPDGTPVMGAPIRQPFSQHRARNARMDDGRRAGEVADVVLGKTPEISLDGLTAARYGQ